MRSQHAENSISRYEPASASNQSQLSREPGQLALRTSVMYGSLEISAELQELGAARAVVRIAEHSVARVVRLVAHASTEDAARR